MLTSSARVASSARVPRDSDHSPTIQKPAHKKRPKSNTMQITLKVENLSVKLTEPPRQVLDQVCAHVKPGQILGKFHYLAHALRQSGPTIRTRAACTLRRATIVARPVDWARKKSGHFRRNIPDAVARECGRSGRASVFVPAADTVPVSTLVRHGMLRRRSFT